MEIYLIHFIFFKIAIDIENESKQQNKYLDGMVIMLLCVCVFFNVEIHCLNSRIIQPLPIFWIGLSN